MINYNHNYGELIVKAINGILWSYEEYGSYQGDYIAIIEKDGALHIYKGRYGSCSGCDEALNFKEEKMEEDIKEYMQENPVFLIIPKDSIPKTVEDFKTLLPANTRLDDVDNEFKLEKILKQLKHPTFKPLEYLEKKYDQTKSL